MPSLTERRAVNASDQISTGCSEPANTGRIAVVAALGNAGMEPDHYRQQAEFCEQQAARASNKTVREQFLTLARQWRELAQSAAILHYNARKSDDA
jgi:hypothetical protein